MPVVGNLTHNNTVVSRKYGYNPDRAYATAIAEMASDIRDNTNIEFFREFNHVMMDPQARDTMREFFVSDSADVNEFSDSPGAYEDHVAMMEALFDNDRQALMEHSALSAYNPVMGLVFPLHKNLLMNNIFDKGAINKAVAKSPKFTLSMEIRKLVSPSGEEIDMFTQQNRIFDMIESTAPTITGYINLDSTASGQPLVPPVAGGAEHPDLVKLKTAVFGPGAAGQPYGEGDLSITTAVTHIGVKGWVPKGAYEYTATKGIQLVTKEDGKKGILCIPIQARTFDPGYGELDRQLMAHFKVTYLDENKSPKTTEGYLSGFMKRNDIMVNCSSAEVVGIVISAQRDTSSAMLNTCSVKWESQTNIVEIPNGKPINTNISPEEVKDIQALYGEAQLTKILGLFKLAMGTWKDDSIHQGLDDSFITMPSTNKIAETFDFAPTEQYALDFVEWRQKTFMDVLDTYATTLIQVLNDPNMTISVIGNPSIIRKITPTEYTYQSPSNIGPIELQFQRTVVTSDKRVYNFISSDKMRDNANLIIILNPRNTDRIVYCIYDYQLYLSNEIRNAKNWALPAVHAFERFKLVSYQPVQGRIQILNPIGSRNRVENADPIGKRAMNDYTINHPDKIGYKLGDGSVKDMSSEIDYTTGFTEAQKKANPEMPDKVEFVLPNQPLNGEGSIGYIVDEANDNAIGTVTEDNA